MTVENIRSVLVLLAVLTGAGAVYLLTGRLLRPRPHKGMADFLFPRLAGEKKRKPAEAAVGSEEYKVRLVFSRWGLDVSGRERPALWGLRLGLMGTAAGATLLMGLPPAFAGIAAVAGWFISGEMVEGKWRETQQKVEEELPTFLSRLSGMVETTQNIPQAVETVAMTMDTKSPLRAWLEGRLLAQMTAVGRRALDDLLPEAYAVSPSLGIAVFEIGRLWDVGGAGFADAFKLAAENQANVQRGRVVVAAKASSARGTVKLMIGTLIFTIWMMMSSPSLSSVTRDPLVQLMYIIGGVWMLYGYRFMNNRIDEAIS